MQTATAATSKKSAAPKKATNKKIAANELMVISEVKLVPVDLIDTSTQIRTEFDQESIVDLAGDILERGLLQPVLLNPTGDRYQLIAGERRLRAVKLNGMTGIPALLTKTSTDQVFLMQLAENVQRENLSLEEECNAIAKLYELLGSLDKVAAAVKKSKPWCSKRYAITQKGLHYCARQLLEDGHTEDIELLRSLSNLINLVGWTKGTEWTNKVQEGKAGRDVIRTALQVAKKAEKEKKAAQATLNGKVSHAKPRTPPPPPPWTINDAMDDLSQALTYADNDLSGVELLATWTAEQQQQIKERIEEKTATGASANGFKIICDLVMNGIYDTPYIELMAMIKGYSGKPLEWPGFLEELQCPREKA